MALPGFSQFSPLHLIYLSVWLGLWIAIPLLGARVLNARQQKQIAIGLAVITIVQEAIDYLNRMTVRDLTLAVDLPLQFCHLAQIFSILLLFFRNPLLFELTYFWGLVGALQAMLTPDLNAFDNHLGLFLFFLHHGLLILIVLWLIFIAGQRCRPWAVPRIFLLTNLVMIPVGFLDWQADANYMYLRSSPVTNSPFISGPWPWYLVRIEGIGLIMMATLQLPMSLSRGKPFEFTKSGNSKRPA